MSSTCRISDICQIQNFSPQRHHAFRKSTANFYLQSIVNIVKFIANADTRFTDSGILFKQV